MDAENVEVKIDKIEDEIENLVSKPTWKEILIDLVKKEKLDPWNIDIALLAEKYVEKVREMKILELRVPANVILAASILLRLKSDSFDIKEEQEVVEETYLDEGGIKDVGMLTLVFRPQPKRNITLSDLIKALDEVMEIERKRMERTSFKEEIKLDLKIGVNIEDEIEKVYKIIKENCEDGLITFSEILLIRKMKESEKRGKEKRKEKEKTKGKEETKETKKVKVEEGEEGRGMRWMSVEDVIFPFIALLHLCNDGKVDLMQEEAFGEIFVRLLNGRN